MLIMQKGFIRYIQKGDEYSADLGNLVGGLIERPGLLIYNLGVIALYAIQLNIYESGILGFPLAFIQSFMVISSLLNIAVPAIMDELKG